MPKISVLETPDLSLRPSETGVEATAAAARRGGAFFNQVADAYNTVASLKNDTGSRVASTIKDDGEIALKYLDHREIGAGATAFTKLQDNLTRQWNETAKNADPNDPSVAAKFRETVLAPALEEFKSSGFFNTENSQKFAEQKVQSLNQHMFEKTAADMSSLAGIAVRKNISDSTAAMSNTAILDPSSVPNLLKGVDHTIDEVVGSSPTLGAVDAARVRSDVSAETKKAIVHAGAIGSIQKSGNPEATADEWIRKYPDYISGADAKALAGNARQQIRARNYDFETNRRREKEIAADKSNEATNQYIIDVRSQDPKLANDPTAKKILNDPTLLKTDKNNLLNYIDRQLKPETDSRLSQQTFVGLLRDLRAPDADPDRVMQKAWDARLTDPGKPGSMTEKDFNQFRAEVVGRKTPEGAALERDRALFFKQYAGTLGSDTNKSYDPQMGSPKLYAAEMEARRMEGVLRQKGLDPHLVYDPASEYFLGNPKRLMKFQGSMQGDLADRAQGGLPAQKDITGIQSVPAPAATSVPRPPAPKPPEKGFIKDGYEFLGGNPGEAASWKKVQ